jgi:hypothetical protein
VPKHINKQCLRVLDSYQHGDDLLDYEAYEKAGMSESGYTHQRCSDLRRDGLIEWTGWEDLSPKNRWAGLCRITVAGVVALLMR